MCFMLMLVMLLNHGRYSYSPIISRTDYSWENNARLAVYVALNVEHFEFGQGLGATLAPGGPQPDVLNYAWRDYGNRVGVWRLLDLFNEVSLPVTLVVNSEIYDYCPEVVAAFRNRGDEIIAHGRTNSERQSTMSEQEEQVLVKDVRDTLAAHEGRSPAGWLGPWIAQSQYTPDLLKEAGYQYMLDWCCDDQPIWFKTRSGPILSIPYPQEINDIPAIAVRKIGAAEFADMIIDNFDEMLSQSQHQPLVCGIALHPYVVGQPFRLRQLRRALRHIVDHAQQIWLTHPGAIASYIQRLPEGVVPIE
ncbi:MAG: polysaccharide deacetylase family protein [Elainellaceae cyanobacterium]